MVARIVNVLLEKVGRLDSGLVRNSAGASIVLCQNNTARSLARIKEVFASYAAHRLTVDTGDRHIVHVTQSIITLALGVDHAAQEVSISSVCSV